MLLNKTDSFRDYLKKEYGIDYSKRVEFINEKIPVEEQVVYTDFSQKRREAGINRRSFKENAGILASSQNDEQIKTALSDMAGIGSIEALKYLTDFADKNKGKYDFWPAIARNECKGTVEYDLTGEIKIYILSPFGSVNGKIKLKATFVTESQEGFSEFHQNVIRKEFAFQDSRHKTETKVFFKNRRCTLRILMPLSTPILSTITSTICDCNVLGCNINVDSLILKNFDNNSNL